jgi:hypothetical protein
LVAHARAAAQALIIAATTARKELAMLKNLCLGTAIMLGVGAAANGAFMLVNPMDWYLSVPGVTTTGPFNQHFIRDIGMIFFFIGAAFLIGVMTPRYRFILWSASTLWLAAHALFHVWEVAAGICEPSVLARDFPAVTLPAIIGAALSIWAARGGDSSQSAMSSPQAGPVALHRRS